MSKKPRGKPVLMEQERPMRRPGQRLKHTIRDEFRNCGTPGCPNIVSVQGPVHCALHRDVK